MHNQNSLTLGLSTRLDGVCKLNQVQLTLTLGFKSYVLFGTHRGVLSSSCCQHPLPCQPFPPPVLLVATSVRSLSIAGMSSPH
jgi:hypothetical protein